MLLDTNAISAWAEQEAAILRVLRADRPWYLPSIALGEYRFGVVNSNRRAALERWLEGVEEACVVLAPDAVTARHYATLRDGLRRANTPIPYHNIWIAVRCSVRPAPARNGMTKCWMDGCEARLRYQHAGRPRGRGPRRPHGRATAGA